MPPSIAITTDAPRNSAAAHPGRNGHAVSAVSVWDIEARHYAFHRALLAACRSPWRLEFFERLYAATERYRIPALVASGPSSALGRDIQAEHEALAKATLARDADLACALLADHYRRTAQRLDSLMAPAAAE